MQMFRTIYPLREIASSAKPQGQHQEVVSARQFLLNCESSARADGQYQEVVCAKEF